ncbi:MAG: hypothetical protein U0599_10195 [Vicinamibacteria bacterium]
MPSATMASASPAPAARALHLQQLDRQLAMVHRAAQAATRFGATKRS